MNGPIRAGSDAVCRRGCAGGRRHRLLAAFGAGAMMMALVANAPTGARAEGVSCHHHTLAGTVPVPVASTPFPYTIVGELCATPDEMQSGATVQLLIHGSTYNHGYWDFGTFASGTYSYARD